MYRAIRAERLSKRYELGEGDRYGSLRDSIARAASAPARLFRARGRVREEAQPPVIWALQGVSFDVTHGEIIGIVGRNGSGKSTLLKILSRITEPTSGSAQVRGRVASLLEVGTGFHPELTGRENVFVNGAILGMKRREIERKFDEIIAFAGVEQFVDTPVKRYSSGMQMRLAFAVAAHLEPNILLVDEVLAVGDLEFQRRCLGKMQEVSVQGRTVLLVSHQMGQIRRLCTRTMWLDRGQIRRLGDTGDTIRDYEAATIAGADQPGEGQCFVRWELGGGGHTLKESNQPFVIRAHVHLSKPISKGHYGLGVLDDDDRILAGWAFEPISLNAGTHRLDVCIASLPFLPKNYRLSFALFDRGNNLTGGKLIEKWIAVPSLTLDVPPVAHPQDEWAGVLNVPARLATDSANGSSAPEAALQIESA
jgi:ABC-type polysaccharide/polyol phosphate transport system ATPase subunit